MDVLDKNRVIEIVFLIFIERLQDIAEYIAT
jgi:hypothetical protein